MALARIITRSDVCSRALALDLLGRGYAVEIVTPDSIPANMADLELRVEAALGDRLTASVIARDGDRSSTLEFVRNLKTSAADLAPLLAKDFKPITSVAEPAAEVARPKVGALLPAPTASLFPAVALLGDAPSHSSPVGSILDREVSAPPISTPALLPLLAEKPPAVFASASSMIAPPSQQPTSPVFVRVGTDVSEDIPQRVSDESSNRTPNLLRSATVVLTILALLMVMVFGMNVLRSGKTAAASTAAPVADKGVPSSAVPSNSRTSNNGTSNSVAPHAQASKVSASASVKSAHVAEPSSRKKISNLIVKASVTNRKVMRRPGHNEDVIARDTVTYLDRSLEKATASQSAKHPAAPHREHGNGVVAASAVTYLNGTSSSRTQAAPTPAK
jgi:hypothetical protein